MKRISTIINLILFAVLYSSCAKIEVYKEFKDISQINVGEDSITDYIYFDASHEWQAESSAPWVKVSPSKGDAGYYIPLAVSIDKNEEYDSRTATITITSRNVKKTIDLTQDEKSDIILDNETIMLSHERAEFSINILANVNYEISPSAEWIRQIGTKALSSSECQFVVDKNTSLDPRSALVVVRSQKINRKIKVTQNPELVIIPEVESISFESIGDEKMISIVSNVEYSFSFPDGVDWIHISKAAVQSENSTHKSFIKITADDNYGEARSARIALQHEGITSYVDVSQAAFVPLESISIEQGPTYIITQPFTDNIFTLTPVFYPVNCTNRDLDWSSSDDTVIKYIGDGKFKYLGLGEAELTAVNKYSGKGCSVHVVVKIKATGFLKDGMMALYWGKGINLKELITPADAYVDDMRVTVSNESMVYYKDGYIYSTNKYEGIVSVRIELPYSDISKTYDISVLSCDAEAHGSVIIQSSSKTEMEFRGTMTAPGGKLYLSSVLICKGDGRIISYCDIKSNGSSVVEFISPMLNMTSIAGITSLDDRILDELSQWFFYVTYQHSANMGYRTKIVKINAHVWRN